MDTRDNVPELEMEARQLRTLVKMLCVGALKEVGTCVPAADLTAIRFTTDSPVELADKLQHKLNRRRTKQ